MTTITDFFKGIVSLALIVTLLVGVPALLATIVGFPLPTELPSPSLIANHIEDGVIPDLFVVKTSALVVWIVWLQLAVAVLAEVFGLLRGRASGRAPVLPGIQLFAGKLVASTVLIVSALTPPRAVTAAPILPLGAAAATAVERAPGPPTQPVHLDEIVVQPRSPGGSGAGDEWLVPEGTPGRHTTKQYATTQGDNWWDIAERLLGDGMRWSEVRQLNTGKTMLTGEIVTQHTETVGAGWHLDVPSDADPTLLTPSVPTSPSAAAGVADRAGSSEAHRPVGDSEDPGRRPAGPDSAVPVGLLDAIRPHMLVYEGPTGTTDGGPGVPYQVVEGDNLWDIARRHLGDGFRWPEIFENSTGLEQTFGRTITDPNLIWPDSILWLPGDAVAVPEADPELVGEVIGPLQRVGPSDGAGRNDIQPEELQHLNAAARRTATGAGLIAPEAGGGSAGADVPPSAEPPAGPDTPPSTPPPSTTAVAPGPDRQSANKDRPPGPPSPDAPVGERRPPESIGPSAGPAGLAFGAGGVLLASGLLGLVTRARKLRLSEAGPSSIPAPPPLELVELETVLRNDADGERARSIHRAIQSLGHRPIVVGEPLAAPEVIRVSGDRFEVVQRGADPDLPAPWLPAVSPALDGMADRSLAVLPAASLPADQDDRDDRDDRQGSSGHDRFDHDRTGGFAPGCVTIGGGLLINLEAIGVLGIDGPVETAAGLVRAMVQELACGPARRSIDLRVSDWLPGADLHEHVRCGPLDHLAGELRPWLEDAELRLAASGGFSAYSLRVANSPQAIPTFTIIFADVSDADRLGHLVDRARRHALPLAVVFSGDLTRLSTAPEAVVRLGDDRLTLEPYGFTAAMQYLDINLLAGTSALVDHARNAPLVLRRPEDPGAVADDHDTDPAQVPTEETPEREIITELPPGEEEVTDRSEEDPDSGILIRVLGPVEFEGGPAGLSEPERSLLTFLALVGPSTSEQLRDAIWPGRQVGDAEFDRTIHRLRALLGPRFPDAGDGRHRLRSVVTDLGSARRWIEKARSMSAERSRNLLQLALTDVRGEPFAGVAERYWQWTADHKMAVATQATSLLIDACFDLCDGAYDANDLHLAVWACEVGSLIVPLHETLVVRRAQLLQALGSVEAARRVVEDWEMAYERAASRPAPRGPRAALGPARTEASSVLR